MTHGGGINGFNSRLSYYPDASLSIAVISNCEAFDSATVVNRIAAILLD